ncbi:MAG: hypothetical protein Q6361_01340 [Candidatus Hermodarchaeota archaeon]|nr:hypothetical protein [Candidatus Hermodarchaeota archaeon]
MRSQNDVFTAVATSVGAVFVAGMTPSPLEIDPPLNDLLLVRYNPEGAPQWNQTWQTSSNKSANALTASTDSLYLVGHTDTPTNGTDGLLVKFDSNGNEMWNTTYGGSLDESFSCISLGSDGLYVGGSIANSSNDHTVALVVKYDFNGLILWNETWSFNAITRANGIAIGEDGGYLVGSVQQFPAILFEGFLLKFSFTGIQMWNSTLTPQQYKRYSNVAVYNETVYVTGISKPLINEPPQLILEQFNSTGTLLWTRIDETGINHEGFGLYATEENIFVGGTFEEAIAGHRLSLLNYNVSGDLNWKRTWGGAGNCYAQGFTAAVDGFYFSGTTSDWLTDSTNGFLVKIGMDGTSAPGPIEMRSISIIDPYGTLGVSWTAAFDPNGTVVDYELQMDTVPLFDRPDIIWAVNGTSQIIYNRPIGIYYFRVRARDQHGLFGPWSNIQMVTITLIPPMLFNPWLALAVLLLGILIILAGLLYIAIRRGHLE